MLADLTTAPPPEKFSRYKSTSSPPHRAPIPSNVTEKDHVKATTIQRSLSRYRKPGASQGISYVPPVAQNLPGAHVRCNDDPVHRGGGLLAESKEVDGIGRENRAVPELGGCARDVESDKTLRRSSRTIAKAIPLGKPQEGEAGVDAAEIAELLAEQKRKDLERLERELEAAAKKPVMSPKPNLVTSKIGTLFSRKLESPKNESKSAPRPSIDAVAKSRKKEFQDTPRTGVDVFAPVDAPVSAVNAGERRILVRCKQSSINLPVTAETTTVDLIYSATNALSQAISPYEAILVESYAKLGLERRIRRYEHIRDVMNSWDRDSQNEVVLTVSDAANNDLDLEASSISKKQPGDVTLQMHHSQHIGNWDKRYVTLLSSGQIFTSKKLGAKVTDKDATTICHLTDFDIYTIATRQARKNIKPPRQHCYAIKSQQKPSMFLNTEKFVHFFSMEDTVVAEKWYTAVQTWRSWYLINVKGEGSKSKAPSSSGKSAMSSRKEENPKSPLADEKESYTIGSLTPLLDLGSFGKIVDDYVDDDDVLLQIPAHLRNAPAPAPPSQDKHLRDRPPVSLSKQGRPGTARDSFDQERTSGTASFATNGLLGRSNTMRRNDHESRDIAVKHRDGTADNGLFTAGSLLNSPPIADSGGSGNKTSHISRRISAQDPLLLNKPLTAGSRPRTSSGSVYMSSSSSPRRTMSTRQTSSSSVANARFPPVPLIDLTPRFVEPQQWNKERKGHGVAGPVGAPLIEGATSKHLGPEFGPRGVVLRRDA